MSFIKVTQTLFIEKHFRASLCVLQPPTGLPNVLSEELLADPLMRILSLTWIRCGELKAGICGYYKARKNFSENCIKIKKKKKVLYSPQQPRVRVWSFAACHPPSLSHPISCHLSSCPVIKAMKRQKKKCLKHGIKNWEEKLYKVISYLKLI